MALTFSSPSVDVGVGAIVVGENGFVEQISTQVHSQGVPRGNFTPDIILNVKEFDSACTWLEQQTLIGYFVGPTPSESMLREWVSKVWTPQGIYLLGVQSMNKGFFPFSFGNPSQVEHVFIRGP